MGSVYTPSDIHEIKVTMDRLKSQMQTVNTNLSAISKGINRIKVDE